MFENRHNGNEITEHEINDEQEVSRNVTNIRKKRNMITDPMFEQIKHLISIKKSVKDITQICNISRASAYRAISKIERADQSISFADTYKAQGRPKEDKRNISTEITNIFASDNSLTQVGLGDKLRERGIHISKTSPCRMIKNCSLSRKRLKNRCSQVTKAGHFEKMREYAFSFSRYVGRNIIFVDDSGFNLHTSISYGYAPPNVSPIKHQPASKRQNISLCAIISRSTLVASKIIDGKYNAEKFGEFIDESARFGAFRDSPVLVMDNASIHKTREILNKLENYGVEVKFIPPYSPDLNPIEIFFGIVKSRLDRIRLRLMRREILKQNIERVLVGLRDKSDFFENIYRHMNCFINNLLNGTQ
ncbi:hypothetical protein DMUE_5693 [Dictyocoela muelleri]|nr:hypothetical protein DMUE_5693 [Dictyocoela muelleri]